MQNKSRKTVFTDTHGTVLKSFITDQPFSPMHEGEKVTLRNQKYIITSIDHHPESVSRTIELKPHLWK